MPSVTALPSSRSRPGPAQSLLWGINAALCVAIAAFSFRYLASVGPSAPIVDGNAFKNPWLAIHVLGAATALLLAPFQFVRRLRAARPGLHRWMGRTYVTGCVVGGISGFVLALGASSGPVSTAGFGLLSIAWLYTTVAAWRTAVARNFAAHRAWMIRSFALTYAAVTLRLYVPILLAMPSIAFVDGYRAISFLCWVPNLIAAEIYLRFRPTPA